MLIIKGAYKAAVRDKITEPIVIEYADRPFILESDEVRAAHREECKQDARALFDLLINHTPGATFDELSRLITEWRSEER